jgi:hypothetical protein
MNINGSQNNIDNSTNNTQNININVFGNEDLTHFLSDGNMLQKLKAYGKKGVYGLADIIEEIHCNKDIPQNNTIIKPLEYGDAVYIMGEKKQWEFREYEDIRDTIIQSVSNFFKKYNEIKDNLCVKLTDEREKRIIRGLSYTLLAMDGDIPNELFEELDIDDARIIHDDEKIKSMLRKFDKATMLKLHEYTLSNFKKDQGKYVRS